MKTFEIFEQLQLIMRQPKLKIRVDHENLETVYLEPAADGKILVHDRGHAHAYLSNNDDSTYKKWDELGVGYIQNHCDQFQLSLENLLGDNTDPGYCVCGRATTDLEVAELVSRVAACQDAIFQAAYFDPV